MWSTVGYGETGLATVPRSLAADSSSPGATPRPGWENSRRPLRSSPASARHPRFVGVDLSLTAISSNERYHSMMPTLSPPPPPCSRFYDRFRSRPFPLDARHRSNASPSSVCVYPPDSFSAALFRCDERFAPRLFDDIADAQGVVWTRNVKIKLNFSFKIVPDCCEFQWRLVEGNFLISFLKIIE